MAKDFTDRLNTMAKKAGMLDFLKMNSFYKTRKLIGQKLILLYEYFNSMGFPIELICGDELLIKEMIKVCRDLSDIEICSPEQMMDKDLQNYKECTILIVGNKKIDTIRIETLIYDKFPVCRVCSIYEYLEFNGINTKTLFWKSKSGFFWPQKHVDKVRCYYFHIMSYNIINNILFPLINKINENTNSSILLHRETIFCANKTLLNGCLTKEEQKIQMKKLMGYCVIEKDILGLKRWIQQYADCYDKSFEKYLNQVDVIIAEMKEKIANRKSKDIILNWVDSISNKCLKKEMPFLYALSNSSESIKSDNAYTYMPWTTSTMKTIMTGKDPISGQFHKYSLLNDNMKLLKQLNKQGYRFLYFGNGFWQKKIIPAKYQGLPNKKIKTFISTEFIWNALNYLACSKDEPQFILIHQLFETHKPFFCPDIAEFTKTSEGQNEKEKLKSAAWIDKQYEFYTEIMGDKSMQIFMGDHGDMLLDYAYLNDRLNIMFFIRNAYCKIDFSKGLFSLKDFPKLIDCLMGWGGVKNQNSINDLFTEYAISHEYDKYEKFRVDMICSDKEKLKDKHIWMQFKTIRTKEYAYVLFYDGEELFYKLPDESNNLIDDPEYADMIKNMRNKIDDNKFIDIYKEEAFIYSRKLYEEYNNLARERGFL